MALSFTGNKKIVNLVFKDHVIRHTELKSINPPVIQSYGEHYLPAGVIRDGKILDHETLQNILDEVIDEWKLTKKQVRFLVPDPFIIIRKIMIPKEVKDDEIEGYLYLELGVTIHLPFEDPVFDAVVLDETNDKKELLLFAAPESVVSEYSDLLENSKLKTIAADISPLSLYRLYDLSGQASAEDHLMLLQVDLETVNASIFFDDKPVFMRQISISDEAGEWEKEFSTSTEQYELVLKKNEKKDYMTMLEDTYTEIERVIDFYKYSLNRGAVDVTKILLTGDHPFLDEISEEIGRRFEPPIDFIDTELLTPSKGEILPNRYLLSCGLALKGVK